MPVSEREFYEVKADVLSHGKAIDNLVLRVEALCDISTSLSLMAQSLKRVESDVVEVKDNQKSLTKKVSELENAPAQEMLVNVKKIKIAAITAVATMLATGIVGAAIVVLAK